MLKCLPACVSDDEHDEGADNGVQFYSSVWDSKRSHDVERKLDDHQALLCLTIGKSTGPIAVHVVDTHFYSSSQSRVSRRLLLADRIVSRGPHFLPEFTDRLCYIETLVWPELTWGYILAACMASTTDRLKELFVKWPDMGRRIDKAITPHRQSALHVSVMHGKRDASLLLLQIGASKWNCDCYGKTCFENGRQKEATDELLAEVSRYQRSLAECCNLTIRKCIIPLTSAAVDTLPIPSRMKKILVFGHLA